MPKDAVLHLELFTSVAAGREAPALETTALVKELWLITSSCDNVSLNLD